MGISATDPPPGKRVTFWSVSSPETHWGSLIFPDFGAMSFTGIGGSLEKSHFLGGGAIS